MQHKPKNEAFHPQEAFLKKVLKILKKLNSVNQDNIKCISQVVENDLGFSLPEKAKSYFFFFMKSITRVLKIVKTEGSHCSFVGLALNGSSHLIHFQKEPLGTKIISPLEYDKEKKCFIYLNEGEFDEEAQLLLNLQQAKEEPKYLKINYQNITPEVFQIPSRSEKPPPSHGCSNPKSNSQKAFKCLSIPDFTPTLQSLERKAQENYLKNIETYSISRQEKAKQNVLRQLGDEELHSEGTIQDYGFITYADFFNQLIKEPKNSSTNKRWINMFLESLSDRWSHPCLVAIRNYIREYPPY